MKQSVALQLYRKEIKQIAEQNLTYNPRVFGSVLFGTDCEGSDLFCN